MRYLSWIIPLTLLYLALTANLEPLNWLLGALIATGITALLRPDPAPIQWRKLPGKMLVALQFVLGLLWDLLVSSVQVSRLVLRGEVPARQGVFALPAGNSSHWAIVLSAQAITLTPGEIVVEISDDGLMYTHSLDVVAAAETEPAAQEQRMIQLERILG